MLGDGGGEVEVVEAGLGEGEIAVEGVDEDFEGVLEGVPVAGGGGGVGMAGAGFGVDAEVAQVGEEAEENAEGVVARVASGAEEEGGV